MRELEIVADSRTGEGKKAVVYCRMNETYSIVQRGDGQMSANERP
jgi:hypothetical protein